MCDGPLVVLRGADVLRDSRVLVVAVVVAPHRLGVVQELPGKQRLHLKHTEVRSSNTRTSAVERRPVSAISQIFSGLLSCSMCSHLDSEGSSVPLRVQTLVPKAQQDLEAWRRSTVEPEALDL